MRFVGHLILIAVLSAGAGYLLWRYPMKAEIRDGAIAPRGGQKMDVLLTGDAPFYLQGDARWGDDQIGGSAESIRSVGCTLCSVAMGLEALGHAYEPGALNAALIREGGYTDRGWLIWSAVGRVTGGAIDVVIESEPQFSVLDHCIHRGWYSLVKFYLPGNIPHWVLVVGKRGHDYLIKDPAAFSGAEVTTLSGRARGIYSVRYLRPAGGGVAQTEGS